jgi:hypothetical protein
VGSRGGTETLSLCSWRMLSLAGQASARLRQLFVEDDNILDEQDKLREFPRLGWFDFAHHPELVEGWDLATIPEASENSHQQADALRSISPD